MKWKGKEIKIWGDYMDVVFGMTNKKEAMTFKKLCIKEDGEQSTARNIGYMLGYINDAEKRSRLYKLFEVSHPIFGDNVPTCKEAFETGKKMGGAK